MLLTVAARRTSARQAGKNSFAGLRWHNNPCELTRMFGHRRAAFLAQSSRRTPIALTSGLAVIAMGDDAEEDGPAGIVLLPGSFRLKVQ